MNKNDVLEYIAKRINHEHQKYANLINSLDVEISGIKVGDDVIELLKKISTSKIEELNIIYQYIKNMKDV